MDDIVCRIIPNINGSIGSNQIKSLSPITTTTETANDARH